MDDYRYEIYHHGIKGQKWGVRRTLAELGHPIQSHRNRKLRKQRVAALEKARVARKEKAEYEAGKQKALKKGTANDILKYKGDLTNEQMQNAVNRITLENRLSDLKTAPAQSKGKSFLKKFVSSNSEVVTQPLQDVSKQLVKSGLVYLTNDKLLPTLAKEKGLSADTEAFDNFLSEYRVYTNNKKKN